MDELFEIFRDAVGKFFEFQQAGYTGSMPKAVAALGYALNERGYTVLSDEERWLMRSHRKELESALRMANEESEEL